ncbi:opsin-5-like protein [Lates japonicus]|uniref:Opsin-5-like protein n=1 Tax=Lates japonicus TaxID=270547 RepID=A0AAD3M8Y2_LATJO|nr:opsin-5-like protein [Lates japonicus]
MPRNASADNWTVSVFTSKLSPAADICVGLAILSVVLLSVLGNGLVLVICYRRRKKMVGSELLIIHYLKTCYSLVYAVWLEGDNIRITCCGIWLVATVWSSFPLFGWGKYVPEPYGLSCTIAWRGYHTSAKDAFYVICSFACFTLVPVLFIVVSQCRILYKVSRFSYSLSARGIRNNLRHAEKRLSVVSEEVEKKAIKSIVDLVSWIAWPTPSCPSSSFSTRSPSTWLPRLLPFPPSLPKAPHIYNPFIYFYFNKTFQRSCAACSSHCGPSWRKPSAHQWQHQILHRIHIQLQERDRICKSRGKVTHTSGKKSTFGRQVYTRWGPHQKNTL